MDQKHSVVRLGSSAGRQPAHGHRRHDEEEEEEQREEEEEREERGEWG